MKCVRGGGTYGAVVIFVGSWIDAIGAVAEVAAWVCSRAVADAASVVSYPSSSSTGICVSFVMKDLIDILLIVYLFYLYFVLVELIFMNKDIYHTYLLIVSKI